MNSINKQQLKKNWPSFMAFFLFVAMTIWNIAVSDDRDQVIQRAESALTNLDQRMQSELRSLTSTAGSTIAAADYCTLYFVNGKLTEWSDHHPAFQTIPLQKFKDGSLITLPNGNYWIRKSENKQGVAVGLLLIKHAFPFENH